jgi:D-galactose 1-dehydrogenase
MKVALVGIGKIALDQHVPAIRNSDVWELAATVSRNGKVDGVPSFADLKSMLDANPDVRVVSLCLPPGPRFEYAAEAIRAGRHVMLEKPPGATLSECHTLGRMARERGVALYATWHSRQADKVQAAKSWLADKSLRALKVTWKEDVRQWHPDQDWVFEAGGLGVFDPGINALSIVTEILPDPIHVTQATLRFPANRQTPISATCHFHHARDAKVTMELDWLETGPPTWSIRAETDDGTLLLENGGGKLTIEGQDYDAQPGLSGEYPRLYAQMVEAVRAGSVDMDLSPLQHVADAFMLGTRETVKAFDW